MCGLLCYEATLYRARSPTPITLQLVASRLNPEEAAAASGIRFVPLACMTQSWFVGTRWKTISWPSGDHVGVNSLMLFRVSCVIGLLATGSMTQISKVATVGAFAVGAPYLHANRMLLPSGDQAGPRLSIPSLVSCCGWPVPSAFMM